MIANRHGRTNLLSLSISLLPHGVSPPRFFVGFLTTTRRRDLDRRSPREKKKNKNEAIESGSTRLLRLVLY